LADVKSKTLNKHLKGASKPPSHTALAIGGIVQRDERGAKKTTKSLVKSGPCKQWREENPSQLGGKQPAVKRNKEVGARGTNSWGGHDLLNAKAPEMARKNH